MQPVISTQTLATLLAESTIAVVDCRFDLAHPEWGFASYREAHIPGAVYAHLDRDLSSPVTPASGRHPLPDAEIFARRLSDWGISNTTPVVVYDTNGGAFAGRLWWLLRYLGHSQVAVLDGGFPKWQNEGHTITPGIETRLPAQFIPTPRPEMIADLNEVERIRLDPAYRLIDARSTPRFQGKEEPIDPVAGHIPGAVNRFHAHNLTPEGVFKPPDKLRAQFLNLLGGVPPQNAVVYCGSGVTSIHHLIAMELAGLPGARLYPGSWSEWIRDPDRPVGKS